MDDILDFITFFPEEYRMWIILLFVVLPRIIQVWRHSKNGNKVAFLGPLGPKLLTWLIGKDFLDDEVLEKIAEIVFERMTDDPTGPHKDMLTSVPTKD